MAHLNFIFSKLPPEHMDTFVVNGCSAGGLATFTWAQTISDLIHKRNPNVKLFGLPDSGFFVDYISMRTGDNDYAIKMKAVTELVNVNVPLPNKRCMEANPNNKHYCIMAEHLVDYTETPLFIEESLYDTWQLPNIL